jgi:ABC-type uncharacterized transport system involved in gliding motility auxiliary subunit
MMRKLLTAPLLHNVLFVVLLCGTAFGLAYLAERHPLQRDLTHNAANSLEPESVNVLRQLQGPVSITVYATEQDPRLGDIRKAIGDFVSLYQRYKPDLQLTFINPEQAAAETRAAGIQFNGEMIVSYAGRSEHLTQINESILTGTLLRLAHQGEQLLMFVEGHGERKLDGIANHDLGSLFGAKLKQNGFRLASLNLALAQDVPDNASLLVITQPQTDLLPGEVDKLQRYLERGGNLLWLLDPGPLHGLETLAENLNLSLPPGIIIDPGAADMNAPVTWALGAAYPPHAITRNFNLITAFPEARAISWEDNSEWSPHSIVEVAPRGWISHRPVSGKPRFEKRYDTPGPVSVAVALQRNRNEREQRIVVVGNGAFLSNTFAGNGGNVDLGVSMVNWLAGEDPLIEIRPRRARDSQLTLSQTQLNLISLTFLLGLPLGLAAIGGWQWWRRRS